MSPHSAPTVDIELPIERSRRYRFFEQRTAIISCSLLVLPPIVSLWFPWPVSVILIVYTLFWLYRSVGMSSRLVAGYRQYRRAIQQDWLALCKALPADRHWPKLRHAVIIAVSNEVESIVTATLDALAASHYPLGSVLVVIAVEARGGAKTVASMQRLGRQYQSRFESLLVVVHPGDRPGEVRGKGAI